MDIVETVNKNGRQKIWKIVAVLCFTALQAIVGHDSPEFSIIRLKSGKFFIINKKKPSKLTANPTNSRISSGICETVSWDHGLINYIDES